MPWRTRGRACGDVQDLFLAFAFVIGIGVASFEVHRPFLLISRLAFCCVSLGQARERLRKLVMRKLHVLIA